MSARGRTAGAGLAGAVAVALVGLAVAPGGGAPATEPLDAQRERVRALEADLARIDAQTDAAADGAAAARARLADLRGRIAQNAADTARARRADARATRRLADRLVAIYTSPEPDPVAVLLTSGSVSEAVATQDVIDRIGRRDARLVAELRETRVRLRDGRARLVAARRAAVRAEHEAAQRLDAMEALLDERRGVLTDARRDLRTEQARRARAAALARAQAAAETAARRRARAAAPSPAAPATTAPTPAEGTTDPAPSGGDGPVAGGPSYATLERIARCESGGNPRAVSSSGLYRGKYQFDLGTWASVGGRGDPAAASEAEQDRRAAMLYVARGPAPWPICGYR